MAMNANESMQMSPANWAPSTMAMNANESMQMSPANKVSSPKAMNANESVQMSPANRFSFSMAMSANESMQISPAKWESDVGSLTHKIDTMDIEMEMEDRPSVFSPMVAGATEELEMMDWMMCSPVSPRTHNAVLGKRLASNFSPSPSLPKLDEKKRRRLSF